MNIFHIVRMFLIILKTVMEYSFKKEQLNFQMNKYMEDKMVKEKFEGLRFNINKNVKFLNATITNAEAKNYEACEFVGKAKRNQQINSWFLAVCDSIYKRSKENSWFPEKW